MSKKKIILISSIVLLAIILGVSAFFIVREYVNNKVSFTVNDTLEDGGGKKATVILLGGQSNAAGCSLDSYLKENVSEEKYQEYDNGYDNVYINYFISGAYQSCGFVKCENKQGEAGGCFGPELGMAEQLNKEYPDQQFFIIKYTWSGTNLFEQWLSPSSDGETGKLYKEFVAFVETSVKYLISKNYDVKIEGMCWMQGESDSFSVENATDYEEHLKNFIKDMRNKFSKYSANDGIAFIDAYIADNPVYWVYCDLVNQSKDAVAKSSDMNALVDTISNNLTCSQEPRETPDMAHYDSMSQIKLGHLFIEELSRYLD